MEKQITHNSPLLQLPKLDFRRLDVICFYGMKILDCVKCFNGQNQETERVRFISFIEKLLWQCHNHACVRS